MFRTAKARCFAHAAGAVPLCTVLVGALAATSAVAATRHVSAGLSPPLLSVTEVYKDGATSISGRISQPKNQGALYSGAANAGIPAKLKDALLPILPPDKTDFATPTDATDAIGEHIQNVFPTYVPKLTAAMQNKGSSTGAQMTWSYIVPVTITPPKGDKQEGTVSETCHLSAASTPSSGWACMGANYGSTVSYSIIASYTQGAIAQGLPEQWNLPNPGQLKWELVRTDSSGVAPTSAPVPLNGEVWHTIDYLHSTGGPLGQYGTYDAIQVADLDSGAAGPGEYLINCKAVDNTGMCSQYEAGADVPNNTPDGDAVGFNAALPVQALSDNVLRALMTDYGASQVLLMYGRTVKPVYDDGPDGTQVAEVAVNVQSRVILPGGRYFFISPGGQRTYNESGVYGFNLDYAVDEYQIQGSGPPQYLTTLHQHRVAPNAVFSKSVKLNESTVIGPNDIINPFPDNDKIYSWDNDTVNHLPASDYVSVVPLDYQ